MELLVVISIIAVLLAILMPSLQKARDQAAKAVCKSNSKNVGLGFELYSMENNGYLVPARYNNFVTAPASWDSLLSVQFGAKKKENFKVYLKCPADNKKRVAPPPTWGGGVYKDLTGTAQLARSYQPNYALQNWPWADPFGAKNPKLGDNSGRATKKIQVKNPSRVLYIIECWIGGNDDNYQYIADLTDYGNIQGTNFYCDSSSPPCVKGWRNYKNTFAKVGDQHRDGGDWMWVDGHISWHGFVPKAEPTKYPWTAFRDGASYPTSWNWMGYDPR